MGVWSSKIVQGVPPLQSITDLKAHVFPRINHRHYGLILLGKRG